MKSDLDAWEQAVRALVREHCAPEVRDDIRSRIRLVAFATWFHNFAHTDLTSKRFDELHVHLTSAGVPSQQLQVLRDLFITPNFTSRLKPYTATDPLPGE